MGACEFFTRVRRATAEEAFQKAQEDARYEYGHGGYTGTIAEKWSFDLVKVPEGMEIAQYIEETTDEGGRFDDKWGPAGCIEESPGVFVFFGWASS